MSRIALPAAQRSKRSPAARFAALLWALAFVLGTAGEGFGLHPCPHHRSGSSEAHGPAEGAHVAHAPVAADHHATDTAPAEPHSGPCTCGSACQAGGAVAVPVHHDGALGDASVVSRAPTPLPSRVLVPSRPAHFLPFAQAPPRVG